MKIILSHSQKQHAYRLAISLKKFNNLKKFYSAILFIKNSFLYKLLNKTKLKKIVSKRTIDVLEERDISRTIIPEFFYHLTKLYDKKYAAYVIDRIHDNVVAFLINKEFDLIIGYERQCLKTFKKSKKLDKITILDLASIHPNSQKKLNEKYNNITTGFEKSNVVNLNRNIKLEEYKYTDYVITLSEYAKETCIENGIKNEKIYNVQLGIDTNFFTQKEKYTNDKFRILFVAGVRYWKGIKDLIEVFKKLQLKNSELIIIGTPGDALNYVKDNLNENIKYISHLPQNELKNYYQLASVFILSSYMDSWGQVVCEAMACGTPVIVSESTGAKDIVKNNQNGFIIETGNNDQLEEKISYLHNNQSELEKLGKEARKSVEKLTWENYYLQINEIVVDIKKRENL